MEDNNNKELIYPTVEWMRRKYNQFNNEIFDNRLGDCNFKILTSGNGSQGKTYGRFSLENDSLRVDVHSRWIYIPNYVDRIYINNDNFVKLCHPTIWLNGHYKATEEAWENVLVHEMCHYYSYMYGKCPKQAHGSEFRNIAQYVSVASSGRFSIQRLATSEEMKNFKLDDDMEEKKNKRLENKKSKAMAVIVFKSDGRVELTMLSINNSTVLRDIYKTYSNPKNSSKVLRMITSTDPRLIDLLYENGFRKIMRTWRLWDIRNRPFVKDIDDYDCDELINNMNENINIVNYP